VDRYIRVYASIRKRDHEFAKSVSSVLRRAKAPLILPNHDLLITNRISGTDMALYLIAAAQYWKLSASNEIDRGLLSYNTINRLIRVYTKRHSQMRETAKRGRVE